MAMQKTSLILKSQSQILKSQSHNCKTSNLVSKPVSGKIFSIAEFLFLKSVEEQRLKKLSNKYYRPENYPNIVGPFV